MNFAPRCILHRCPNQFIHRYTWTEVAIAIWLQAQLSAYVLNIQKAVWNICRQRSREHGLRRQRLQISCLPNIWACLHHYENVRI